MIDLTDLRRVQMRGGTRVHATAAPGARMTACDRTVHLYGPTGRPYDRALEPDTTVTCPTCQTAAGEETVIVGPQAEFEAAARRALADLGLTYAELQEQARRGDFSSSQAHALWVSIGGTVQL